MADLAITTSLTQIEQALQSEILLAYGKRLTAATPAALRTYAAAARSDDEIAYVTSLGFVFRFNRYSTGVDDGTTIIKPTDGGTAGRWLVTTSTVTSGYLKAVELYEGEADGAEILKHLNGTKPGVVIVFQEESFTPRSTIAGALYKDVPEFDLWCISSNLRHEKSSTGSSISAEAAADPGVNRITGDLMKTLAGSTLGDQAGIGYVEIVSRKRESTSLDDRLMVYSLRIRVYATLHNPEDDLVALASVRAFDVQRQLADLHGDDEFDEDNYIVSGLTVPTGASLTQTVAAGSAYLDGTLVAFAGASKTFTASRDTYRDLTAGGTFTYVAVANGSPEPSVTASAIRIGLTITDGTGVTEDRLLAATLADFGDVDQVPPT